MYRILFIAATLAMIAGCAAAPEGSRGQGAIVTADGRIVANTDQFQRRETAAHIQADLNGALAPYWQSEVAIAELPVWREGVMDGDWYWPTLTASVILHGSGPLPISEANVKSGVERYLAKKSKNVVVTIEVKSNTVVPPPVAETQQVPSTSRSYTVQAGDTLADIATLFYGAPESWRLIVNANPGIDPAKLAPGTVLTIPPRP